MGDERAEMLRQRMERFTTRGLNVAELAETFGLPARWRAMALELAAKNKPWRTGQYDVPGCERVYADGADASNVLRCTSVARFLEHVEATNGVPFDGSAEAVDAAVAVGLLRDLGGAS